MNLTEALRQAGIASDIYYGTCTPDMAERGKPVNQMGRFAKDRWLLYHASIGSPVFDLLSTRREPKLVNYHNITPAGLLASWAPQVSLEVALGRAQLERLAPNVTFAVADSSFNEAELLKLGYRETAVVPLLIDMTSAGACADAATEARFAEARSFGGCDLLYVGKISPHKAPHDLVKVLALYRRLYDPKARLHLVGSPISQGYAEALGSFIDDLGLKACVEVPGSITASQLEAYFAAADVYLSASEHEGFCVPIVEAMGHGVPVIAYASAAVPETVGEAGILLHSKEPLRFAAAIARVMRGPELRSAMSLAGLDRASKFDIESSKARFVDRLRCATS